MSVQQIDTHVMSLNEPFVATLMETSHVSADLVTQEVVFKMTVVRNFFQATNTLSRDKFGSTDDFAVAHCSPHLTKKHNLLKSTC